MQLQQQQIIQQHIQGEQASKLMCISGINNHIGSSNNCVGGPTQHECQNYNCTMSHSQWIQQQGSCFYQRIGKQNKMEESETNLDSSQINNESSSQQSSRSMSNRSANWYTRATGAKPGHHSHCINCALVQQEQR